MPAPASSLRAPLGADFLPGTDRPWRFCFRPLSLVVGSEKVSSASESSEGSASYLKPTATGRWTT
jgi:hypothetical protein